MERKKWMMLKKTTLHALMIPRGVFYLFYVPNMQWIVGTLQDGKINHALINAQKFGSQKENGNTDCKRHGWCNFSTLSDNFINWSAC